MQQLPPISVPFESVVADCLRVGGLTRIRWMLTPGLASVTDFSVLFLNIPFQSTTLSACKGTWLLAAMIRHASSSQPCATVVMVKGSHSQPARHHPNQPSTSPPLHLPAVSLCNTASLTLPSGFSCPVWNPAPCSLPAASHSVLSFVTLLYVFITCTRPAYLSR